MATRYGEFQSALLIGYVIASKGDFNAAIAPADAIAAFPSNDLDYPDSWLVAGSEALVKAAYVLPVGSGNTYSITPEGLEEAEEQAGKRFGFDLYEMIERHEQRIITDSSGNPITTESGDVLVFGPGESLIPEASNPAEAIVAIDHSSDQIKELNGRLAELIEVLRGYNDLDTEERRRLAELKSGADLLKEDTIDKSLFARLILNISKLFATEFFKEAARKSAAGVAALAQLVWDSWSNQ